MDERPNNNPNQQPIADELTLGEALRTIAERTAFRSEEERDKVYAALDKADRNDDQDDEDDKTPGDDEETPDDASAKNAPRKVAGRPARVK